MTDLPRYPDSPTGPDDHPNGQTDGPRPTRSRGVHLWWAAGIGLVLLFIVLHLTGVVGPAEH